MSLWRKIAHGLVATVITLAACGDETRLRPLSLDIQGLSSRASLMVIQLVPGSDAPACATVNAMNVNGLDAPIRLVWVRTDESEKMPLAAPDVETENLTVIVHAEDAAGAVIQLGCREVNYLDLESPEVEILLTATE